MEKDPFLTILVALRFLPWQEVAANVAADTEFGLTHNSRSLWKGRSSVDGLCDPLLIPQLLVPLG